MPSDIENSGIPESLETSTSLLNDLASAEAEAPRVALTLKQAAAVLGKSPRALERCILGRWGNRLPDGWTARRIEIGSRSEWRIMPPPEFVVKRVPGWEEEDLDTSYLADLAAQIKRSVVDNIRLPRLVENQQAEHATIVIDRSDEVELLLKELLQTQKQLSEERRLRMDDLRLMSQLQGSMRLLEDRAAETSTLREALTVTRQEFEALKDQYVELLKRPWWRRLFS